MVQASVDKYEHDIGQLTLLIERGRIPREPFQAYITRLAELQTQVLAMPLDPDSNLPPRVEIPIKALKYLQLYKRHLYSPPDPSKELLGSVVNPGLDTSRIEAEYRKGSHLTYFDDFLRPEALEALLLFCEEATVFQSVKGGYLGSYMNEGFGTPLLAAIARDLQKMMPSIFGNLTLEQAWAYKYENKQEWRRGTAVHADHSLVNLNFWITPDESYEGPSVDGGQGGMIVYTASRPDDWSFNQYNHYYNRDKIMRFLEESKSERVQISYKQNRAVLFSSKLFHETDRSNFKPGYRNRRINVTFLFGVSQAE